MNNTAALQTNELSETIEAFLFSCITPAFVWSVRSGKLIKANAMGYELFHVTSDHPNPVSVFDFISNWNEIPEKKTHSIWLEYNRLDEPLQYIQVRNSFLSDDFDLLLTVIVNPRWRADSGGDRSLEAFSQIVRGAFETFCSRTDFLEKFEGYLDAITVELQLSDLLFLPGLGFKQYDLYDKLQTIIANKPLFHFVDSKRGSLKSFPRNKLSPLSDIFPDAPSHWQIYPLFGTEELIGYFLMEFRDNVFLKMDYYQLLLDMIAVNFQSLFENMEMTKALYQSEFENSLNSQIIDHISEGVIITNSDYLIVYINQISSTMFGFSPADVIGHQLDDLFVTTDGIRKLIESLASADGSNDDLPPVQYFHRRSGETFPCHLQVSNLNFDEKNKYTIFVLTDISESEESRLKTEQLAQRAFLGDFASLLAHEIRNPINNMNIWIQNIKGLCQEGDEIFDAASRIEDDCSRVSHLISNILAFSKPLKLNLESVDLAQFLSDLLERWKLNFARSNIKSYYAPPASFPNIMMTPRTMEQVFNNLIGNAVDALDNKGGVIPLKVSLNETEIGRKQALISISDNGPGIPDEMIDHIFEPFVTSKKKGNGWGLALSKRIITSHKGTIQVKSYPGGTVFEILLPILSGG